MPPYRIMLLSSLDPRAVARLISRVHQEVADARVVGVLYEQRPPKSFRARCGEFLRQVHQWAFLRYVAARIWWGFRQGLARVGSAALRFLHAQTGRPNARSVFGTAELGRFCDSAGCALHFTANLHAPESLAFARSLHADLGLVYGTRILKPELFNIPEDGSINIHKRKLPDYRGGGPIGLWELLDGQSEIGVTVHRVTAGLDAGAVVRATNIPIEPLDTLMSLGLKADVVGEDLLVAAVADFARGSVQESLQLGRARMFRTPSPQELHDLEKRIAALRPPCPSQRQRPFWKLALRMLVLGPWVLARNWWRRGRASFPVIVLYHHLVTDRLHCLGISTELFLRHVEFLQRHYQVVGLDEAVAMLQAGKVSRPTVVLTFDDGYRDNFINLRAVMEATGVPVTLFVCTEKVTRQQEFEHDLRWGYRSFFPLDWEQVGQLKKARALIGSHTRSHFDCGSADRAVLQREIGGSRTDLEQRLGNRVEFFSFPWGLPANMSSEAVELAKSTYRYVCSAAGGVNYPGQNGKGWHIRRCFHPNDLWELELTLQSILELN